MKYFARLALSIAACVLTSPRAEAGEAFGLPEADRIAVLHAEGAQIYQCQKEEGGSLHWKFKEPIASLFDQGKSIGRHYVGPAWELVDGTVVRARVAAQSPPASTSAIPHLFLTVTFSNGTAIADAKSILRINTKGGVAPPHCGEPGAFLSVPYSADYAFYKSSPLN